MVVEGGRCVVEGAAAFHNDVVLIAGVVAHVRAGDGGGGGDGAGPRGRSERGMVVVMDGVVALAVCELLMLM